MKDESEAPRRKLGGGGVGRGARGGGKEELEQLLSEDSFSL